MNFAEKLQILRRRNGFTQENFAGKLGVSRQAVAKWEMGAAYPEIDHLIEISNLLHVTVDYLLKEQECAVDLREHARDEAAEIMCFRIKAGRNTYAACMNETVPTRLDSHDFRYEEGEFVYYDTYVGGERFAGEEVIWKNGRAVYAMNYIGRVLTDAFSGNFLKEALRAANMDMPYRGPAYYAAGEYVYTCKVKGSFSWFLGEEEILCSGKPVYECRFHGGLLSG